MKNFILILSSILILGCDSNNEGIRYGTFDLYENDSIVGTIYRINNYQIEKYLDNSELIARIDYQSDSTYLINGIEETQIGIDSIVWLTTYKEIGKNKYKIIVKPNNSSTAYQYEATLVKIENKTPKMYSEKLDSLNHQ